MSDALGEWEGELVLGPDGDVDGASLGEAVSGALGEWEGELVVGPDGDVDGAPLGEAVGDALGEWEGESVLTAYAVIKTSNTRMGRSRCLQLP